MTQPNINATEAPFRLSGTQMNRILHICGASQSDFARFIKRSPSFVNRILGQRHTFLPLRWLHQLILFTGTENFNEAYRQISTGEVRKALPARFLAPMLKVCGYSLSDFCRFLHKGTSFFYDNATNFRHSIPLRYIDALEAFLGKHNLHFAAQEVRSKAQEVRSKVQL